MRGVKGREVKNFQNMSHENLKNKIIAKMIKKDL